MLKKSRSILDYLGVVPVPCRNYAETVEKVKRLADCDFDSYTVTITYDHKYKVTCNGRQRLLRSLPPTQQYKATVQQVKNDLQGFDYVAVAEFTKAGMIHYHILLNHKIIEMYQSGVETAIKQALFKYGRRNFTHGCEQCRNINGYIDYIFKEHSIYEPLFGGKYADDKQPL